MHVDSMWYLMRMGHWPVEHKFEPRLLMSLSQRERRGCMVVGFTTTFAISAYHH
jgi:hypothetical protein